MGCWWVRPQVRALQELLGEYGFYCSEDDMHFWRAIALPLSERCWSRAALRRLLKPPAHHRPSVFSVPAAQVLRAGHRGRSADLPVVKGPPGNREHVRQDVGGARALFAALRDGRHACDCCAEPQSRAGEAARSAWDRGTRRFTVGVVASDTGAAGAREDVEGPRCPQNLRGAPGRLALRLRPPSHAPTARPQPPFRRAELHTAAHLLLQLVCL